MTTPVSGIERYNFVIAILEYEDDILVLYSNKIKASENPEVIKNIYDDEDIKANAENIDDNLSENDFSNDEIEQEIYHHANIDAHMKSLHRDIEGVST